MLAALVLSLSLFQYTLARSETFSLPGAGGPDYHISVALPAAHTSGTQSFPVVYLLDGDWYFALTVSTARLLEAVGELPPLIVVSVGYGGTVQDQRDRRIREFTPFREENLKGSGHADEFLAVLQQRLIPEIEKRYRTTPDRTLIGHSLGGLFATFAMARAPGLFDRVVIGSPALWSSGPSLLQELSGSKQPRVLPKRVFLGVAESDFPAIRTSYDAWRRTAQSLEIRWTAEEFAKTTHQSVVPALLARALAWSFAD